jgi:hypothetical protein
MRYRKNLNKQRTETNKVNVSYIYIFTSHEFRLEALFNYEQKYHEWLEAICEFGFIRGDHIEEEKNYTSAYLCLCQSQTGGQFGSFGQGQVLGALQSPIQLL